MITFIHSHRVLMGAVAIVLTASLLGASIPAPTHADPITVVLAVVAIAAVSTGGIAVANVIDCHVNVFWGCNNNGTISSNQICPAASNGGATGTYPSCTCNNGGTYTSDTNSCSNPLCSAASGGGASSTYPNCTCTNTGAYNSAANSCGNPLCSAASNGGATGTYPSCTCNNGGTYTSNTNSCSSAPCTFNGTTIASGNSVTAYSASTAVSPVTCPSISQTRICSSGVLSGSYTYQSCNVATPCTSAAANSCGMHGNGFLNTQGVCGATVPPDSACPAPVISAFSANPSRVNKGGTSTLKWSVTNASVCALSGGGLSLGNLSITGSTPTNAINNDTTFTLNCADNLGPVTASQVTVHLIPNYKEL